MLAKAEQRCAALEEELAAREFDCEQLTALVQQLVLQNKAAAEVTTFHESKRPSPVHAHAHIHTYTCTYTHTHARAHIHTYTLVHIHIRVCRCMYEY